MELGAGGAGRERKAGVVLFAHGSRLAGANDHVRALAARLRAGGTFPICEAAFLELASPALPEAVAACVAQGAERVVVVPYFLALGRHVAEDLPALLDASRRALGPAGAHLPIEVTDFVGNHPVIVDVIRRLVEEGPRLALPTAPAGGGG
ncbi:MAG TPA: CbiX/SirB N-terminal domain-containing protein [Thermodesulfobacteriota bacterium]|nr:CbiX/SirB N-terminal domain-containing protein [Thermodesulfobacteriota bacterium]